MAIRSKSKRFMRIGKQVVKGFRKGLEADPEDWMPDRCKGPYRLAFISHNAEMTRMYLRELAQLNHGRMQGQRVQLGDGTLIFPIINARSWDGLRFDQVIVAGDRRSLIRESPYFWEKMKMAERYRSHKVPDEFFVQYYDLDAERSSV